MRKILLSLLVLMSAAVLVACNKSEDEGGQPVTQKPANFKGQEGSEANGPKAGSEVGTAKSDAP